MPKLCRTCGRSSHSGLCNLIELSNGKIVHASRVDSYEGDVRAAIDRGEVKVKNRWIKRK